MAEDEHAPEGAKGGLDQLEEIVDIEVYAKNNQKPPPAKKYKFRIDRDPFTVDNRIITGEKLFELAGKSPTAWRMHQKLHGGNMKEVKVADEIDLGEPGIERFVTMELTQGDGEQATANGPSPAPAVPAPLRQFRLPEDDESYLGALGLRWETVKIAHARWLFIHDQPVPAGYKVETVTIAIRIEGGYPPGALDMAYFLPHLERSDGKPIVKATPLDIDGVSYQRWSRHYTWREGIDCLATHYMRVLNWLEVEPKR